METPYSTNKALYQIKFFSVISHLRKDSLRNEHLWAPKHICRRGVPIHTKNFGTILDQLPNVNLVSFLPPFYRHILRVLPSTYTRIQPLLQPHRCFELHPFEGLFHAEDPLKSLRSFIWLHRAWPQVLPWDLSLYSFYSHAVLQSHLHSCCSSNAHTGRTDSGLCSCSFISL